METEINDIGSPNQTCNDVIESLDMKFKSLKVSQQQKWSELPQQIKKVSLTALSILKQLDGIFDEKGNDILIILRQASLDESVTKRNELTITGVISNRSSAFVGDKLINLYIAKQIYRRMTNTIASIFQEEIEKCASNHALALFFDHLFQNNRVLVNFSGDTDWDHSIIEERQKATYIESLVGLLYEHGHANHANFLIKRLIEYRKPTNSENTTTEHLKIIPKK